MIEANIGAVDTLLVYYAAGVPGQGERRDWLRQAGYTTFVPTQAVEARQARRKHLVRRPVFPGCVFVGRRPEQSRSISCACPACAC